MTGEPASESAIEADPTSPAPEGQEAAAESNGGADRLLIITPEGMAMADAQGSPAQQINEPAKVMRIGSMVKQLLEEVRSAPLDDAARARLAAIHDRSVAELKEVLAPELADELSSIALPFDDTTTPSDAELRIAQAQLVGWLEGLFHGIQSVLFAQQMMARAQFEQMRKALPGAPAHPEGDASGPPAGPSGSTSGPYL